MSRTCTNVIVLELSEGMADESDEAVTKASQSKADEDTESEGHEVRLPPWRDCA